MQIQPLIQFSWIHFFAACTALVLSVFLYRQTPAPLSNSFRILLWILRLTFIAILLVMGVAPVWNFVQTYELKPHVIILEDVSQSIEKTGKTEDLAKLKPTVLENMAENGFVAEWHRFADGLDGASTATDFAKTLETVFTKSRGQNLQAIILASDGQDNGSQNPVPLLIQEKTPVFVLGLGEEISEKNAKISQVMSPNYAFLQEEYPIRIRIRSQNFADESAVVSLFEEGQKIGEKEIQLSESFAENEVEFTLAPQKTGNIRYTARLELAEADAIPADNEKSFLIDIQQQKAKVFCFATAVGPDLSAVMRFLRKQQDIQTVELFRAGNQYLKLPSSIAALPAADADFDCAVLFFDERNQPSSQEIKYLQNLLKNTNCLVFGAIPPALADALPLQRTNIQDMEAAYVEFLKPYHNTLSFLEKAPSLTPVKAYFYKLQDDARMLAFAQLPSRNPVIAVSEGANKVMHWAGKGFFLWQNETLFLEKFLDSAIRWLRIQEKVRGLSVQLESQALQLGEPLTLQAQVYDELLQPRANAEVKAEFFQNDSLVQTAFLEAQGNGQFSLSQENLAAGDYQIRVTASEDGQTLGKQQSRFVVAPFSPEQAAVGLNRKWLEQLAQVSGGAILQWEEAENWPLQIPNETKTKVVETVFDFRNSRTILLILLALFAIELFWRKRKGLR